MCSSTDSVGTVGGETDTNKKTLRRGITSGLPPFKSQDKSLPIVPYNFVRLSP